MQIEVYLWRTFNNMPDEQPLLISSSSSEGLPQTIKLVSTLGERSVEQFFEYTNLKHKDLPLYHQVKQPTNNGTSQP